MHQTSSYAGEDPELVASVVNMQRDGMLSGGVIGGCDNYWRGIRPNTLAILGGASHTSLPGCVRSTPGDLSLADVSEAQRLLDKFALTDLTQKGIKTAQDFPELQKKLKCIAGNIKNCRQGVEGSFEVAVSSFDTLSPETAPQAWLGQLLDIRVANAVKLCSSEKSQAAFVFADIQRLYTFMEQLQVGTVKEVEDRLLIALLNRSKFNGWLEVLEAMAHQNLLHQHAGLQTAVLLSQSSGNASAEDLEKAVQKAQSMETSKCLSRLIKTGARPTHIFGKMRARGAIQKLQKAHNSGSYIIFGEGFTEIITTIFAANAALRTLVDAANQEPEVARSAEFGELQSAMETVGATLKTKIKAFLDEMWDGVVSDSLDISEAWKSFAKVQALVGNIRSDCNAKQEELDFVVGEAFSALSLRAEWRSVSSAEQPLDANKLVAFMRSVKSGQDLSGLTYKSDRSNTFFAKVASFANDHLAKLETGKIESLEALLRKVCGGALDEAAMKTWLGSFFARIKTLDGTQESLEACVATQDFQTATSEVGTYFECYDRSPLQAYLYSAVLLTFARLPVKPFPDVTNNVLQTGDAEIMNNWLRSLERVQRAACKGGETHAKAEEGAEQWSLFQDPALRSEVIIQSLVAADADARILISARFKAALQDVLTRSDKVLAEEFAMYVGSVPHDCENLCQEVDKLASELTATQKNPKARTQSCGFGNLSAHLGCPFRAF